MHASRALDVDSRLPAFLSRALNLSRTSRTGRDSRELPTSHRYQPVRLNDGEVQIVVGPGGSLEDALNAHPNIHIIKAEQRRPSQAWARCQGCLCCTLVLLIVVVAFIVWTAFAMSHERRGALTSGMSLEHEWLDSKSSGSPWACLNASFRIAWKDAKHWWPAIALSCQSEEDEDTRSPHVDEVAVNRTGKYTPFGMPMHSKFRHDAADERAVVTNQTSTSLRPHITRRNDSQIVPDKGFWKEDRRRHERLDKDAPTLYCFSLMRPFGYEPDLLKEQYKMGMGIFDCDESIVFSNTTDIALGLSLPFNVSLVSVNLSVAYGGKWNTALNADIFIKVWYEVFRSGRYRFYDWVVKTDPDTVFLPSRLRQLVEQKPFDLASRGAPERSKLDCGNCKLVGYENESCAALAHDLQQFGGRNCSAALRLISRPPPIDCGCACDEFICDLPGSSAMYINNCKYGLHGPIEVLSRKAVDDYVTGLPKCAPLLQKAWGEDKYMDKCMQELGIQRVNDFSLLNETACHEYPASCEASDVAFHPFKTLHEYVSCWEHASQFASNAASGNARRPSDALHFRGVQPDPTDLQQAPPVLHLSGACTFMDFVNGAVFHLRGTTRAGAPFYKAEDLDFYIYFDPDCDGDGPNARARWLLDSTAPSLSRINDLDEDGDCQYYARFDSEAFDQPPAIGNWSMFCDNGWGDQMLALDEDRSRKRIMQGICYAPVPLKTAGAMLLDDDFMDGGASALWGEYAHGTEIIGRGDLSIMRALGANAVRLYGNDPNLDHSDFLDTARANGLDVIVGFSDYPYVQMAGNCMQNGYDCYSAIKAQYANLLKKGFLSSANTYHTAIRTIVLMNEPELKLEGAMEGNPGDPQHFCKALVSAFDGVIDAEREAGVEGWAPNISVAFSFGMCKQCSRFKDMPALGQMWDLRNAMQFPESVNYTAQNDLWAWYQRRFTNSFNTQNPFRDVQALFLNAYDEHFQGTPVFIGEYHSPLQDQLLDLHGLLDMTRNVSTLLMGLSFFEFQIRYDKGGGSLGEKRFGMFGLSDHMLVRDANFSDKSYSSWCLTPVKQATGGAYVHDALSDAFGGAGIDWEKLCPGLHDNVSTKAPMTVFG